MTVRAAAVGTERCAVENLERKRQKSTLSLFSCPTLLHLHDICVDGSPSSSANSAWVRVSRHPFARDGRGLGRGHLGLGLGLVGGPSVVQVQFPRVRVANCG